MRHSNRSIKRRNARRKSRLVIGVSFDSGCIALSLPGRRKSLVLSRHQADITLKVLESLRPLSSTACAPSSCLSLATSGSGTHA